MAQLVNLILVDLAGPSAEHRITGEIDERACQTDECNTVSRALRLVLCATRSELRILEKNILTLSLTTPADEYVIDAVHTNTIEGFWSLIKRGCVGTFHKVSKKDLPLYVAESQFRYNNRENADIFGTATSGC
jgi:hypothetical protein